MADRDQVIAALQLLMSDMDERERFFVYRAAFRSSMVFMDNADANRVDDRLYQAKALAKEALGRADGTSGLGVVAAQNLNSVLLDLNRVIEVIESQLSSHRTHHKENP